MDEDVVWGHVKIEPAGWQNDEWLYILLREMYELTLEMIAEILVKREMVN